MGGGRMGMKARHAWLCWGPAAVCLLDAGLTLLGQPDAYWSGRFDRAVEANPPFLWLLRQHPLYFAAGVLSWLVLSLSLILCLPGDLARAVAFLVHFVHTLGAASWLVGTGGFGYLACVALFTLS